MSRMDQYAQNQQTHWSDTSNPQLPNIGDPRQPANAWSPPNLVSPQPQPNYSHISIEMPFQGPLSATKVPSTRLYDSNMRDNDVPSSRPQDTVAAQGSWHAGSITSLEHGSSSNEVISGRIADTASKRPSRKRKAPPVGETQWEQKKPYIEQLYMSEDLPLPEVIRRMGEIHQFFAT